MSPGYKQTDVGVIPKEWKVSAFDEVFNITAGGDVDPNRSQSYRDQDHPYPIYSNALTNSGLYGFCSYADHPAGSITVTARGMIGAANFRDHAYTAIGRVLVLHPRSKIAGIYFSETINNRIEFAIESTGVPQLTAPQISKYKLPVPPFAEQQAIAEALSDVDALLGALDRLIAKKRDLKQAAMQQLLTGQTRLAGFHGEWELKRLDELADIRSGGTPSTSVPQFWDGTIPWCTPTDITALNGRKYLSESHRMITPQGLKASSAEMIPAHSIVMTSRATIGECAINTVPVSTNQGFKNFIPSEAVDVEFLYYLLLMQKSGFISLCGGSTFLEIGKAQLAAYSVRFPNTRAEQTAIAEALSGMDAELAGLEQRREKTRALKQGVMQELLTGRTRLIAPEPAYA